MTIKTRKGDFWEIRAAADHVRAQEEGQTVAEVLIFGRIGESFFDDSLSARDFVRDLQEIEADVIVARINSPGGSVPDGIAIHNALRRHGAEIEVSIEGVALSIASMIAMAGDTITMSDNALFMMHAPWALVVGNSRDMRKFADVLDKHADAMVTAYNRVLGEGREDEIRELLTDGEDHWFTAEEARDFGFVEDVTEAVEIAASFDLSHIHHIPAAAAAFQQKEGNMSDPKNRKGRAANRPNDPVPPQPPAGSDPDPTPSPAPAQPSHEPTAAEIRQRIQAEERERRAEIRQVFEPFAGYHGVPELQSQCLDDMSITADAARTRLLNKIGEGAQPLGGAAEAAVMAGEDEVEKRRRAKTEALISRMGVRDFKGDDGKVIAFDGANPYRGLSLGELARASLKEIGVDVTGQSPAEFADKALAWYVQGAAAGQTTSDFPVILEDTMHKLVVHFYNAQPVKYPRFSRIGQVSDFREHQRHAPGMIGGFSKKNEAGEYTNKNLPDSEKQTIQADEYGNVIVVDRKVLVNDDIGQIMGLIQDIGMAGARGVDRDVFALLASNPTLKDGTALFHADHGNLAGTGEAPSVSALAAGADAMAAQQAPGDDGVHLDIQPAVSVSRHTLARDIQVVVESQYDPDASNKLQKPNKVRGLVSDIVGSPRISGNEWYLFADPNVAPVIEVAFLNGQSTPRLIQEEAFRTGSLQWRPTLDYAVGAVGYRGGWKNPGAA